MKLTTQLLHFYLATLAIYSFIRPPQQYNQNHDKTIHMNTTKPHRYNHI